MELNDEFFAALRAATGTHMISIYTCFFSTYFKFIRSKYVEISTFKRSTAVGIFGPSAPADNRRENRGWVAFNLS